MAQTAHILNHFHFYVIKKFLRVERINTARENKFLPDQNSIAVAKIVKAFLFIKAATPNANVLAGNPCPSI